MGMRWPPFPWHSRSAAEVLVALAAPGFDADAVELALLRAGHTLAWRASDVDEAMTQLAARAPEVLVVGDHPAVATPSLIGACDLLGVRACLLVAAGVEPSAAAQRLGLLDVLLAGPDGVDVRAIAGIGGPTSDRAPETVPVPAPVHDAAAWSPAVVPAAPVDSAFESAAAAPASTPADPAREPEASVVAAPTGESPRHPRVIVVWGPAGAPGRTTLAIGLAAELAARGRAVCLIDADTYGGTVAPALGLLDEAPGFAAACRLAGSESLTMAELDRVAQQAGGEGGAPFAVLTGIGRPHRWPELSTGRVTAVLDRARRWREVIVVDAGFNLETDEEVSSDLAAPRRNAATVAALRSADQVVAVGGGDPIGLARLLRSHGELLEVAEGARVRVVINRVRASVLGIDPRGQVRQTLERFAGIRDAVLIDNDADAADLALLTARPVTTAAPRSALSRGIAELADAIGFARAPATSAGPRWARRRAS
jgi:MinD-like ATPase involved in chromosome partitioning or flagellar assembly